MRLATLAALALTLSACGASLHAQNGLCSNATLAEIEAAYIAEVLAKCDGQSFDDCLARKKIDEKYDTLRKEWVQCRN